MENAMGTVKKKMLLCVWVLWALGQLVWCYAGMRLLMAFGNLKDTTAFWMTLVLITIVHLYYRYLPSHAVTSTESGGWTIHFNQIIYPIVFCVIVWIVT